MSNRIHIPLNESGAAGTWHLFDGQPIHRCPECKKASAMVNHSVEPNGEVNASIACFAPCTYHVWGILDGWTHGKKLAGAQDNWRTGMKLKVSGGGFYHFCPACERTHFLPQRGWTFSGSEDRPTFTPSFKHGGKRTVNVNGIWNGEWHRNSDGSPADGTCHYIITAGHIQFCADSWHKRSDAVPMPDIPQNIVERIDGLGSD